MSLAPGAILGPYQIAEPLGRGGMGVVYKARDPKLDRFVAIKVMAPALANDPGFRERFRHEARIAAGLAHPYIVTVLDYGEHDGVAYLVTELIDGGSLASRIGVPVPPSEAARLLAPIAAALDYAHERRVIHRDVKPSVILLWRDGTPALTDFGIATIGDELPDEGGPMKMGTLGYLAPEVIRGEPAVPASDQYGLAVVAYELLTGQKPFPVDGSLAALPALLERPPLPPRSINPALSPAVDVVVLKGLAKAPSDRHPSVSAFVAALAGCPDLEPSSVAPADATGPATRPDSPGCLRLELGTRPAEGDPFEILHITTATLPSGATIEWRGDRALLLDRVAEALAGQHFAGGAGAAAGQPVGAAHDRSSWLWLSAGDWAIVAARDATMALDSFPVAGFPDPVRVVWALVPDWQPLFQQVATALASAAAPQRQSRTPPLERERTRRHEDMVPGADLGPYHLVERIDQSEAGPTFRAYRRDSTLLQDLSITVLPWRATEDPETYRRIEREAASLVDLRHPHILAIDDVGEDGGIPYIATAMVDGDTLDYRRGEAMPVAEVVRILGPIAAALDYAHGLGAVHGRVRPRTILIRRDGVPVLGHVLLKELPVDTEYVYPEDEMHYRAPERWRLAPLTAATDRYALAAIAYELLTGHASPAGDPGADFVAQVADEAPRRPNGLRPALSKAARAVLMRGLARRPGKRYPTAAAFVAALADATRQPPGPTGSI